jgi:hypothetical protein
LHRLAFLQPAAAAAGWFSFIRSLSLPEEDAPMRFFRFGALAVSLSMMVALSLALTGCGGGSDKDKPTGDKPKDTGGTPTGEKKALMSGKGSLKGTIKLDKSENLEKLVADAQKQHETATPEKNRTECMTGAPDADKKEQKWIIGTDNGLKNVFVWLQPVSGTDFAVDETNPVVQKTKDHMVTLDQPFCAYEPHAFVLFPSYAVYKDGKWGKRATTGEKLKVKSSAKFAHNTNLEGAGMKFNQTATSDGTILEPEAKNSNGSIPLVEIHCDIHKQMKAYALVVGNPYFAITDKDGNYEIKDVPAGKVKLFAWHEGAGFLTNEKGDEIELTDKETTKDFSSVKAK